MSRALAILILLTSAARSEPLISFDTTGGDTWTFALDVAGHSAPERCDAVTIASPLGETRALQTGDRFAARLAPYAALVLSTSATAAVSAAESR